MPSGPKKMQRVEDNASYVAALAGNWQLAKHDAAEAAAVEEKLKAQLKEIVAEQGEPDDKGHYWLPGIQFPGWEKGKPVTFNALQRQKSTRVFLEEEEAAKVLEKKGLLELASVSYLQVTDPNKAIEVLRKAGLLDESNGFEVVTSISEDKIRDLYYDELITEEEYKEIFTTKITWALLPGRL